MDVQLDDDGRIAIPKAVQDQLGIESGSTLEIRVNPDDDAGHTITLRPQQTSALQQKDELLVHTGQLTEDPFDVVEQIRADRRERAQTHAGLDG